jgi:hypothetical protein
MDGVHEGATPSAATLDELQQDVEHASDAIDDALDPKQPRNPESGGECRKKGWS